MKNQKNKMSDSNQQANESKSNQRQLFLKQYYQAQEKNDVKPQANSMQKIMQFSKEDSSVMHKNAINSTIDLRSEDAIRETKKQHNNNFTIVSFCTEKLKLNPSNQKAFYLRATAFIRIKDYSEAMKDVNQLLSLDPSNANYYFLRGAIFERLNDIDSAIKDYTEALRLNPDHVNAAYSRGSCESKAGNYQKSIEDYWFALSKDEGRFKMIHSPQNSILQNAPYNSSLILLDNILTKSAMTSPRNNSSISLERKNSTPTNIKSKNLQDYIKLPKAANNQKKIFRVYEGVEDNSNSERVNPIPSAEEIGLQQKQKFDTLLRISSQGQLNEENLECVDPPLSARTQDGKESNTLDSDNSLTSKPRKSGLERFLNPANKPLECKNKGGNQNVNIIKISIGNAIQSSGRYINVGDLKGEDKKSFDNIKSDILNLPEVKGNLLDEICSPKSIIKGQYLNQAYENYNAGNYKNAILLFSKLMENNKYGIECLVFRGLSYFHIGNYIQALEDLSQANKLNPNNCDIYCYKGQIHLKMKQYDLAIECASKIIEMQPDNGEAHGIKGICEYKADKFMNAVKELEDANKLGYKFLIALIYKAKAYQKLDESGNLIKTLLECENELNIRIQIDSKIMLKIAKLWVKTKDQQYLKKSVNILNKILKKEPKYEPAIILRGIVYCMQENHKYALEDFNKINNMSCESAQYFYYKASSLIKLKNLEEACITVNQGLYKNPQNSDLLKQRANILKYRGYFSEAIAEYSHILEDTTDETEYIEWMMNRAFCFGKIDNFSEAIADYSQILERAPKHMHCYFNRAICFQKNCEYENAIKDFNKVIESDQKNANAYYNRACCYEKQNLMEQATKDYSIAFSLSQHNSVI